MDELKEMAQLSLEDAMDEALDEFDQLTQVKAKAQEALEELMLGDSEETVDAKRHAKEALEAVLALHMPDPEVEAAREIARDALSRMMLHEADDSYARGLKLGM